ncbi:MAG: hypothetical protein IPH96_04600 [Saprospiraceae bacterium]|nr:hypothetical protein [Saprospiraceae bacterium]
MDRFLKIIPLVFLVPIDANPDNAMMTAKLVKDYSNKVIQVERTQCKFFLEKDAMFTDQDQRLVQCLYMVYSSI